MGEHYKINTGAYAEYLQSVVKLNALEKMTQDLDKELTDSQNIMKEIKAIYNTVSNVQNSRLQPDTDGMRPEDLSKFFDADVPDLLMPDMTKTNLDYDIDVVVASIKTLAEDLKTNITVPKSTPRPKEFVKLDLEQYAQSFDKLNKHVANIKLYKKNELNQRNTELEGKLTQLCDDVNKFTNMVQVKMARGECNISNCQQNDSNSLQYDSIITKMLSGINEVTYLLQNKN